MKRQIMRLLTPLATVALMLVFAALTGCEKKPEVYTTRGEDPAYQKELEGTVASQKLLARRETKIAAQIARLEARARAALPEGATPEQVRAELDANPAKYPGWKDLSAESAKVEKAVEAELAEARRIVRRRIEKEAADRKAVAKGEAVAKPAVSK